MHHIEQVDKIQMAIKRQKLQKANEEERKAGNGMGAEEANGGEEDHSYREAQCELGCDPLDVNDGSKYLFLQTDANEEMRKNTIKTRYIFLDEESKERPIGVQEDVSAKIPVDARLAKFLSNDQKFRDADIAGKAVNYNA